MKNVLIINASARRERSISRFMTDVFIESWKQENPDDTFSFREVGLEPVPHVTERWIAGAFKPAHLRDAGDKEALKISDELIAELRNAQVIVIGTPMYNWSVPSSLKAYIDQTLRINETVLISNEDPKNPYKGLLTNKKVYLLMVRGNEGYEPGNFYEHMDFQSKYLKTVFNIMGIDDVEEIALNGMAFKEGFLDEAEEKVKQIFSRQKTSV